MPEPLPLEILHGKGNFSPETQQKRPQLPKPYCPTALLLYLGKRLESLVVKRVSHVAISLKVLSSHQFDALPKRSFFDLVRYLIHDIEEACSQRKVAFLLITDIREAFDTALLGCLKYWLQEQGKPI